MRTLVFSKNDVVFSISWLETHVSGRYRYYVFSTKTDIAHAGTWLLWWMRGTHSSSYMAIWSCGHVRSHYKKHSISSSKRLLGTNEVTQPSNHVIIWVTCQIKTIMSPLLHDLWPPNFPGWEKFTHEVTWPSDHVVTCQRKDVILISHLLRWPPKVIRLHGWIALTISF